MTRKAQGSPPRSPSWKAEEPDLNPGIVRAAHGSGPSHCGCCCLTRGQSPQTGAVTVGYTPGLKVRMRKRAEWPVNSFYIDDMVKYLDIAG